MLIPSAITVCYAIAAMKVSQLSEITDESIDCVIQEMTQSVEELDSDSADLRDKGGAEIQSRYSSVSLEELFRSLTSCPGIVDWTGQLDTRVSGHPHPWFTTKDSDLRYLLVVASLSQHEQLHSAEIALHGVLFAQEPLDVPATAMAEFALLCLDSDVLADTILDAPFNTYGLHVFLYRLTHREMNGLAQRLRQRPRELWTTREFLIAFRLATSALPDEPTRSHWSSVLAQLPLSNDPLSALVQLTKAQPEHAALIPLRSALGGAEEITDVRLRHTFVNAVLRQHASVIDVEFLGSIDASENWIAELRERFGAI